MLVTTAEAGESGEGQKKQPWGKGVGRRRDEREALQRVELSEEQLGTNIKGTKIKVREQRKRWRKFILLEIDMTAVVENSQIQGDLI